MTSIIYYSNYCDASKRILQTLAKTKLKEEIHFLCIDKRVKSGAGAWYIVFENGEKVIMPPQINRVPALLIPSKGHQVLYGDQILQHFQPMVKELNKQATEDNGEPLSFSLGKDSMGSYGVASDNYTYLDQSSDELKATGNGGMRQLYNYATVDYIDKIECPEETWRPDKVGSVSIEELERKRSEDVKIPGGVGPGAQPPPAMQARLNANGQQLPSLQSRSGTMSDGAPQQQQQQLPQQLPQTMYYPPVSPQQSQQLQQYQFIQSPPQQQSQQQQYGYGYGGQMPQMQQMQQMPQMPHHQQQQQYQQYQQTYYPQPQYEPQPRMQTTQTQSKRYM